MQEPIRTLRVEADASGVRPSTPQYAGVQGEHNATQVIFALDAALLREEYRYRFEFVDSLGGLDVGEEAAPAEGELSCLLPEPWTRAGGCGTLRLCAIATGTDGQEEQVVYTLPALLIFALREGAGPLENEVKTNLSALMGEAAGAAEDAAQAAETARDKADEAAAAAGQAREAEAGVKAAGDLARQRAEEAAAAAGAAAAAAGQAQAAKAAADTAAGGANAAAEQAQAAAASAGTAAGTASTAASQANAVAQTVQAKLDAGELKGEKGDKGDTGPRGLQGLSGVYVGGGDMPEGYSVQVDPAGETACYTAGESDARYLRATEIRRPFTDGVIALTDADDAAFGGVTVLGETHETGTGDKGPDNPYTLTGVQPTKVTACGRNLADAAQVEYLSNKSPVEKFPGGFYLPGDTISKRIVTIPCPFKAGRTYVVSYSAENVGSVSVKTSMYLPGINQYLNGSGKPFVPNADTDTFGIYVEVKDVAEGVKIKISDVRVVLGDTAAPYEPYTGQTVSLPAIAPLWGTGNIRDEYDAATGVETRRWKRLVFDGTENWGLSHTESGSNRYYLRALDAVHYNLLSQIACSHWPSIGPGQTWQDKTGVTLALGNADKNIWLYDPRFAQADLPALKAYLAAQYAAGTPVTVVYQLAEPVVTRYGPQRIPTYPAYTYLALNAPAEGAVRYPLSASMQWDGKADKAAVYDQDTADSRFAGVLTGTASGAVACLEDASPVGPLRRAAALGATTETGEGDKGPDNPYTIAGVQPTKITVCGKNLLPSNATSGTANGLTRTVDENGIIRLSGAATGTAYIAVLSNNGTPHVWLNEKVYRAAEETKSMVLKVVREDGTEAWSNTNTGNNMAIANQVPCGILQASYEFAAGAPDVNTLYPYLGLEANQPYQPYTGQTITLPTLAPLYGDGTVCDEYDAATGVEIRRWGRVELDGTEAWATSATETAGKYRVSLSIADVLPTTTFSQVSSCRCSHYTTISADNTYHLQVGISANYGTSHGIFIYDDAYDAQDLTDWKAYLAAQAAAGTPVTVLYQLAAPVVTQHDPARLLPPAPACRVFADAGSVDVGYNRDINSVVAKLEAALANQAIMLEGDE